MPRTHPPYPREVRRQIVELVRTGRAPEEMAEDFEPSASAIRSWSRRKDGLRPRSGKSSAASGGRTSSSASSGDPPKSSGLFGRESNSVAGRGSRFVKAK